MLAGKFDEICNSIGIQLLICIFVLLIALLASANLRELYSVRVCHDIIYLQKLLCSIHSSFLILRVFRLFPPQQDFFFKTGFLTLPVNFPVRSSSSVYYMSQSTLQHVNLVFLTGDLCKFHYPLGEDFNTQLRLLISTLNIG